MSLEQYRLKLRKNKDCENIGSPQYSLKYRTNKGVPEHIGFDIISLLVQDKDLVLMLNSSLVQNQGKDSRDVFSQWIGHVQSIGLFYQYKKTPTEQNLSVLGFQVQGKKKIELQELAVYIPNEVWKASFRDILPVTGARYFVTKTPMSVTTFMNGIFEMSEAERAEVFLLDFFDLTMAGQMGISSKTLDEAGIRNRLGLKR